jgi:hypothetical protein
MFMARPDDQCIDYARDGDETKQHVHTYPADQVFRGLKRLWAKPTQTRQDRARTPASSPFRGQHTACEQRNLMAAMDNQAPQLFNLETLKYTLSCMRC